MPNKWVIVRSSDNDGEWILDVLGVPFGGPYNGRDSYDTLFDEHTNLREDRYPGGIPAVYYHGLDEDGQPSGEPEYIGLAKFAGKKKEGAWYKVILDKASEYARKVWEAAKAGMAAASSGTISHLAWIDENGHVDEWPVAELSCFDVTETQRPANPYAVVLPAARAIYQRAGLEFPAIPNDAPQTLLRGGASSSGAAGSEDITKPLIQGVRKMDPEKLKEIINSLLAQLAEALFGQLSQLAGAGEGETAAAPETTEAMQAEAVRAMADRVMELVQKDTGFRTITAETVTDLIKQVFEANRETLFEAGAMAAMQKIEGVRKANADAALRAVEAAKRAAPPVSAIDTLGGHTPGGAEMRITGVEDLRYAHLSAEDMMLGYQMFRAQLPEGLRIPMKEVVSPDYLRAMSAKAVDLGKQKRVRDEDTYFMRAASVRANELDTTGNTGFGPEWVSAMWSTMVWEKARADVKLYQTMLAKGMIEVEVPQGAGSVPVTTEGSDPVAYVVPVNSDVDATGRPTVSTKISPFGTGNVSLSPNELAITAAYKIRLEEDSIVSLLPQLNKQLVAKANETIEQVLINGDTETAANTNINLIDGTPGTGTSTPYYINSNGILKYPLVTNTALKRDAGGQFSLDDWRLTLKLLGVAFREKLDNLLFLLDSDAHMTALAFPELATSDVRPNGAATIEAGRITRLYGIDVLVSGFMPLANSAGKVPAAGGTLGRLAAVFCPYWAFGNKRLVTIETAYDMLARTNVVQATLRFDTKVRGADAAAVSYDVGIA